MRPQVSSAEQALAWEREATQQASAEADALRLEVLALEQALGEARRREAVMVDAAELERERDRIFHLEVNLRFEV